MLVCLRNNTMNILSVFVWTISDAFSVAMLALIVLIVIVELIRRWYRGDL